MTATKVAMVILAGPIKHWWDENWDTTEHWHYVAWREAINDALVAAGTYLVYRPHEAFKGDWTERGQAVNDAALRAVDVVINMTPPGIPSEGTEGEVLFASSHGAIIVDAPPSIDFEMGIEILLEELEALGIHRPKVDQEKVIESIDYNKTRDWMVEQLLKVYIQRVIRVHYFDDKGHLAVEDLSTIVDIQPGHIHYVDNAGRLIWLASYERIHKIEVLARLRQS